MPSEQLAPFEIIWTTVHKSNEMRKFGWKSAARPSSHQVAICHRIQKAVLHYSLRFHWDFACYCPSKKNGKQGRAARKSSSLVLICPGLASLFLWFCCRWGRNGTCGLRWCMPSFGLCFCIFHHICKYSFHFQSRNNLKVALRTRCLIHSPRDSIANHLVRSFKFLNNLI